MLLATASIAASLHPLDLAEDLIAEASSNVEASPLPAPPVKLDKNLRRALLKALVDLEAESAEQSDRQKKQENGVGNAGTTTSTQPTSSSNEEQDDEDEEEEARYDFLEISKQKSASFTFDGFPNDEDTPSEDKLQNSSFVETEQLVSGDERPRSSSSSQRPPKDFTKGVQVSSKKPHRELDAARLENNTFRRTRN